jgi:hypothetical protein
MPQVSPLPFTGALHVACVNTCICRAPVGWYVECIAILLQNFVNTTEYQVSLRILFKRGISKQRISK